MLDSVGVDYFRDVYERNNDPWQFATSAYEKSKYDDTLQSLPRTIYQDALEIGCSIGGFTERLSLRCRRVLATDVSHKALTEAKARCKNLRNVTFGAAATPIDPPNGSFDLIVLAEVGYYWSRRDLIRAADQICDHLRIDGQLILVHWLPVVSDYPLTGDDVHNYFLQHPKLRHVHGHRREKYRVDLFQSAPT